MSKDKKMFRKVSMERLSSPEDLDQVLQVTTSKGWLALLTLAGLILVALAWGFLGTLPTKVQGTGIFISGEGVKDISAPTSGQITTVYVSPGERLQKGQMVARIAQPELITKISQTRTLLSEIKAEKRQIEEYTQKEMALQAQQNKRKTERLSNEMQNLREQIENLEERRENQATLLEKGLITKNEFLSTKEDIKAVQEEVQRLSNKKEQIPLQMMQFREEQQEQIRRKERRISEVQRELQAQEERLEEASKVYSPHSGRILEVPVTEGSRVNTGTRIASLELAGAAVEDLVGVLYVPAGDGKQVEPGMMAHLSPSTVRKEEDGSMIGLVTNAGDFPATREGMMRITRNELLVEQLSKSGSSIEILVSPIPSPDTFSGYQWTSAGGPDQQIHSGTMTTGSIIVDKQAPITLVIPWLKKNILGLGAES
ncbi:MAG: NHLP bacteriocin system secretion protein [Desulfohalobiaceae bacterium]